MRCSSDNKNGFTLVEIIIAMVLVSILAAVAASIGLPRVTQGVVFTKMNAATTQKGQIAITKLVKEFNNISAVDAGATDGSMITFTSVKKENGALAYYQRRIKWYPNEKVVTYSTYSADGTTSVEDVMIDQVSGFTLNYYGFSKYSAPQTVWQSSSRVIEIALKLTGASDVQSEFTARVRPRNVERK